MSSRRKLRIGIIDLVTKGPTRALFARVMNANLASIMPQVVGVWCEELGHEVTFVCYTGFENLVDELPEQVDLLFICAFTEAALTAYARERQLLAVTDPDISSDGIGGGLTAVVSVKLEYPQFEGCTHGTLGTAEVRGYVRQAVEGHLGTWLAEHPQQAAEILDRIM